MLAPVSPDIFGQSLSRNEKLGGIPIESNYQWQCGADCGRDLVGEMTLVRTMRSTSGSNSASDSRTVEGSASITFNPELQGISSLEVSTVETIGPLASGLKIRSHLDLKFVEEKHGQSAIWAEKGNFPSPAKQDLTPGGDSHAAIDRAVISNMNEGEILSELRQHQDLTDLPQSTYLRLKSWIALHPESLPKFTGVLAAPDASETVLRSYIKALGAVGHGEAQDAMVEVMRYRAQNGDGDTVDLILTGLTLVKDPTERAEKALRELAMSESPVLGRDKAKLALGAMGYHLRTSSESQDKGRALALERDLGKWLSKAQDRETREAALGALGNLGPSDIGLLTPYIASDDPAIRARAYFALRFSPAEAASQVLVDGLATQTSPVVRRDALEALAMRPKDQHWLSALEKVPVAQLDGGEKLILGRTISAANDLDAKSRTAMLERLEAGAKEPEVRQELGSYLRELKR
jgi:HEAT repeat protein